MAQRRVFIYRTSPEVLELIGGRALMDPIALHSLSRRSRLVVNEDGSSTPIINLIAMKKFGMWDPDVQYPYWLDRDHQNESLENVALAETFGEMRSVKIGGPSAGSKEYWKDYRQKNKERIKAHQKKAYEKRKELLKAARQLTLHNNPNAVILPEDDDPLFATMLKQIPIAEEDKKDLNPMLAALSSQIDKPKDPS